MAGRFDAPRGADDAWRPSAACREVDPEVFFPVSTSKYAGERAKRVCRGCPVRAECLQWALDSRSDYGVFGGLDQDERAALLRRAIPARC